MPNLPHGCLIRFFLKSMRDNVLISNRMKVKAPNIFPSNARPKLIKILIYLLYPLHLSRH